MQREIIVEQKLVADHPDLYRIWEIKSYTEYNGCQCNRDCSCSEDFKSEKLHYFKCIKLKGKIKTFFEFSLHDCYVEFKKRGVII